MILKLYKDAFISKVKSQVLWAGAYKSKIDQPGQMEWSQFSIKYLGVNFGNSILDNSNWDKINESIRKIIYIWNRMTPFER